MSTQLNSRVIAGAVAVLSTDKILLCNTGAGTVTPTLPVVSTLPSNFDEFFFVDNSANAGTNNITITAGAGNTINGSATFVGSVNNTQIRIWRDGTTNRGAQSMELDDMMGVLPISKGGTGATTAENAMFNLAGVVRITTTGINAKVATNTALYTVPAGKTFLCIGVVSRVTAVTGAGNGWHISVGTNAAVYNDVMANVNMNATNTATEYNTQSSFGNAHQGATAEVINVMVNTAATTTTMTCSVELIGYLV